MMAKYFYVSLFILVFLINKVAGQANNCPRDALGEDPDGKDVIGAPDGSYFLACGKTYTSSCCAIIDTWRTTAEITGTAVELMIWRPTSAGSTSYKLISSTTITPGNTNRQTYTTVQDALIMPGDCLGWRSTGAEVINHKNNNGDGIQAKYMAIPAGAALNDVVDWSAATSETDTDSEWGIQAELIDSTNPSYATATTTYSIPESTAPGYAVATITFTDTDFADELTLTMSTSPYFSFTDNGDMTGTINTSASVQPINAQTRTLTFTATDLCNNQDTGSITVTIVNTPPYLSLVPQGVSVPESTLTETYLASFTCNDTSGSITQSLVEDPANSPPFFFSRWITGHEYGIYARSQSDANNVQFNYTRQRTYELTIQCSDGVTADDQFDTLAVDVIQNNPPVITNLPTGTTVNVDQSVTNGTIIFVINTTDAEGDQVFLDFSCDRNPCDFIVLDSGEVQITKDAIDFTYTGFDLFIDIRDSKNNGIQRTLSVTITGINDTPMFTNMPNNVNVNENTAVGTSLFTVSYTDSDTTDNHTMYWTNPDGGSALFDINAATGEVTIKNALNYEALATNVFPFTVVLSDGTVSVTSTVTVSVNDVNEPLTWNSPNYRTNVVERENINTIVNDPGFAVTEPDTGDTFSCKMDCGAQNGYYIMASNCVITVQAEYTLDTGMSNTIVCTVNATDNGPFTDTTTLTITVDENDDFTPTFGVTNYGFSVSHYDSVNTAVGTVTATDGDIGTYGAFSYSLDQSGLSNSYFKIDAGTGAITTQMAMSVCNCSGTTLTVPVIATDTGGLKSTATVYVTVSVSTTTVTTTTTDWYKTFFDDERDIVWFCLAMALLAVTVGFGVFICMKYVCLWNGKCCKFSSPKKWRPRDDDFDERRMGGPSKPTLVQCRLPPPPSDMHSWKQNGNGRGQW